MKRLYARRVKSLAAMGLGFPYPEEPTIQGWSRPNSKGLDSIFAIPADGVASIL